LAGVNRVRRSAAGYFALTVSNGNHRRVAVFVDVNTVRARPQNVERQIRRVDFQRLIVIHSTNTNIQRTFRQADLDHIVVKI
jgi:hypothetical protein